MCLVSVQTQQHKQDIKKSSEEDLWGGGGGGAVKLRTTLANDAGWKPWLGYYGVKQTLT